MKAAARSPQACCPPRDEPDLRPVEGDEAGEELAALAKALAHPVRVKKDEIRVLTPGGRLAITDVVKTQTLPEALENDVAALTGCVSGAASVETIRALLRDVGFDSIQVDVNERSREFIRDWLPGSGVENYVASATIQAVKPGGAKSCCGPSCCAPESSA